LCKIAARFPCLLLLLLLTDPLCVAQQVQYGNLLLKHEGQELAKANQFADELIGKYGYEATSKPAPCQGERDSCFSCYKDNKEVRTK